MKKPEEAREPGGVWEDRPWERVLPDMLGEMALRGADLHCLDVEIESGDPLLVIVARGAALEVMQNAARKLERHGKKRGARALGVPPRRRVLQ